MHPPFKARQAPVVSALLLALLSGGSWAATAKKTAPEAAASAPEAAAGDESLDQLRQRLAERLSQSEPKPASAKVATGRAAMPKPAASRPPYLLPEPKPEPKPETRAEPTHGPAHWDYSGAEGPEHWAELSPDNKLCAAGTRQSPIDIRDGIKVELEKIRFDYRAGGFAVLDNGHTVQVNVAPGNSLQVMGRRYELQQFHFHRPGEERINGRQYEMVVHLVHRDAEGRLAVVAVQLERSAEGRPHAAIQSVWNHLPLEKGEALAAPVQLDPIQLLPAERGYYTYMGSLTTPPCSEGVLWMVMRQPLALSAAQIAIFAKLYPMNARPIQAASGRLIKESQ